MESWFLKIVIKAKIKLRKKLLFIINSQRNFKKNFNAFQNNTSRIASGGE